MIRELREELDRLRSLISSGDTAALLGESNGGSSSGGGASAAAAAGDQPSAAEQLATTEKLMAELSETYEDKLEKTHKMQEEREAALREMGIALRDDGGAVGVFSPKKAPHLLNLNEDPLMSELLLYYLSPGITRVGSASATVHQDIQLSGLGILDEHCIFEYNDNTIAIVPLPGAEIYVNGERITERRPLSTGSRVIFGNNHVFRFINPEEARRRKRESVDTAEVPMDWASAQKELLIKQNAFQFAANQEKHEEVQSRLMQLEAQVGEFFFILLLFVVVLQPQGMSCPHF